MRKSRYTAEQISKAIKDSEDGIKVKQICENLGISEATFYSWKKKYAGLNTAQGRRIKELEESLHSLSRELQLISSDKQLLQSIVNEFFTTGDKRKAVAFLQNTHSVGTRRSCRLLNISRSVYHYPLSCDNQ
ncbi:transposase [Erwiniaceae bacterium CAU 1747]